MSLGIYISIPFCKSKCSYCNFASGVFPPAQLNRYVEKLCADIVAADEFAPSFGAEFQRSADSIYFGGGTPSLLQVAQLEKIFSTLHREFEVSSDAESTMECAPGTLSEDLLATMIRCGVNRVSLGVQSFVDSESRAVGRLHTREQTLNDIRALRAAGITSINLDLVAGLPHQDEASWRESLDCVIATDVPHVSVYILEVDEDSRLGRELIAGGTRYHAHFVPDEALTVRLYEIACERLSRAGIEQYEISNFARPGSESRHNLKYWTRQPYFGFGMDAHSMLRSSAEPGEAVRFAMPDSLETYLSDDGKKVPVTQISAADAWAETFFLGLRLNRGADLKVAAQKFGSTFAARAQEIAADLTSSGLVVIEHDHLRLTPRGRLLSNEVFERFLPANNLQSTALGAD